MIVFLKELLMFVRWFCDFKSRSREIMGVVVEVYLRNGRSWDYIDGEKWENMSYVLEVKLEVLDVRYKKKIKEELR